MKLGKWALAALLVCFVASAAFAADDVIKIGVYLPLTGQNAFGGQLELDGVNLAHSLVSEVLGKKVELVVLDNKGDTTECANAMQRLVEQEKVNAVIGTYGSSCAMAGGEINEKAGVPAMGTSCTNPLVTQNKKYYFRACFIDPFQGKAVAQYAFDNGKKKAALLLDVAQDYTVGLGKFFKDHFTKIGGEVVAELNYQSGDQDFTAQITEIISKGADILFIPSYFAEGAIIIKQARDAGAEFLIIGADAMDNPEMVKIGGKAIEGFTFTTFPYAIEMPDMSDTQKAFTEAWQKQFPDKEPNANSALGYDSYMLVIDAIKRAGSADPEAITTALAATKDFDGVTGKTTINETHDAEKAVGIKMVKDGKITFVTTVLPQ
jgi:branched-chain amino acid transport system substrate-binding protein